MKCICIKKSSFYHIDDSFSENSDGGIFEFEVGKEYECLENINDFWGNSYEVIHSPNKSITWTELDEDNNQYFNKFFNIIK